MYMKQCEAWASGSIKPVPTPSPSPMPAPAPTPMPMPMPTPTPSPQPGSCNVGDSVPCPDGITLCAGSQCCPDGSTCPSADNSFTGCAQGKSSDCTTSFVV